VAQFIDIVGTMGDQQTGTPSALLYKRDEFLNYLETDLDQVFLGSGGQEFAEDQNTVEYIHTTGEVENYPVIFDNPTIGQKVNPEAIFEAIKPQILVQETKLARAIKKGDKVRVRAVWYYVEDYHSDGVGLTSIFIRRK